MQEDTNYPSYIIKLYGPAASKFHHKDGEL